MLLLCSRLLEAPPAFAVRYKPLMLRLLQPLMLNFNLLSPEQMAQVRLRPTVSVESQSMHCMHAITSSMQKA